MRQDFVSNVSHEIQSPLTSIRGFAALLQNQNLFCEEKKSYLGIIQMETKRLFKLSDNLLKLSALDCGTVWINLLSNGIKFTPYESKMYVSIKREEASIKVIIKDSGISISEEEQRHIFERFYMVDKSRKRELGGNGLGLAIAKKIVDLHRGTIKVESEINKGASFIVSLSTEK